MIHQSVSPFATVTPGTDSSGPKVTLNFDVATFNAAMLWLEKQGFNFSKRIIHPALMKAGTVLKKEAQKTASQMYRQWSYPASVVLKKPWRERPKHSLRKKIVVSRVGRRTSRRSTAGDRLGSAAAAASRERRIAFGQDFRISVPQARLRIAIYSESGLGVHIYPLNFYGLFLEKGYKKRGGGIVPPRPFLGPAYDRGINEAWQAYRETIIAFTISYAHQTLTDPRLHADVRPGRGRQR